MASSAASQTQLTSKLLMSDYDSISMNDGIMAAIGDQKSTSNLEAASPPSLRFYS